MGMRAVWDDIVIAEADDADVKVVEGNVYFPPEAVKRDMLVESSRHSRCYWKGRASYYHLDINGVEVPDAAWYYPKPWPLARGLRNHVAFWRGVRVEMV